MPARKPLDPNAKPQIEKFREAAPELGYEDNEEAFWDKVVQVAKHKPKDEPGKPQSTTSNPSRRETD